MEILETIELQILGGLHKIKSGNSTEGEKDIEKVSRKSKASCKSIKIKLNMIEKEMKNLKDENKKLHKENKKLAAYKTETTKLKKEKSDIQEELNKSQSVLSSYLTNSLDDKGMNEEGKKFRYRF